MENRAKNLSESYTPKYIVIKKFEPRLGDELPLHEGDIVELLADDSEFDDGWYKGKNLTTNVVGLYPKVFTKLIEESNDVSRKPSLLRSRSRRTPQGSPITSHPPNNYFNHSNNSSNQNINNISNNSPFTLSNKRGVNKYVNDIDQALKELNMDQNTSLNSDENSNNLQQIHITSNFNKSNVVNWTPLQVCQYFSTIVDSESAQKFIVHKISGSILLELELPYLKELDISSFGTRFEIYKEIEDLRKYADGTKIDTENLNSLGNYSNDNINNNSVDNSINNLSSSTNLQNSNEQDLQVGIDGIRNSLKVSNNGEVTPKRYSFNQPHNNRPQSYIDRSNRFSKSTSPPPINFNHESFDSEAFSTPSILQTPTIVDSNEQFVSPRKAPAPPDYASPVSNNPTKFGIKSPKKSNNNINPMTNGTKRSTLNKLPILRPGHSRQSSLGNTSSIYVDTASKHSRTPSMSSNTDGFRTHRRYSSIILGSKDNEEELPTTASIAESAAAAATSSAAAIVSSMPSPQKKNDRRSVSAKEFAQILKNKDVTKRVKSDIGEIPQPIASVPSPKTTNSSSSSNTVPNQKSSFRSKVGRQSSKLQTSAFQEGIRSVTPDEAIKDADYSGWMFKRGNLSIGSWKHRFFTLHKTRLSYYVTTKDTKEKGLIDITSHRVLPAIEAEDKLSAVYAATAGYGRYCFKLIPPAPGSKQGLTFTQQKVHYFAVETKEEMRGWMSAIMKSTIELDESVPVISSCVTPTIPLQKAQELMVVARENAKENFDNFQRLREQQFEDPQRSSRVLVDSSQEGLSSTEEEINIVSGIHGSETPSSTGSSVRRPIRDSIIHNNNNYNNNPSKPGSPLTATYNQPNGMSTPYIMTAGLNSPNTTNGSGSNQHIDSHSGINTPARMASLKINIPTVTKLDDDEPITPPAKPGLTKSNSFSRRMLSLRRVSKEKD